MVLCHTVSCHTMSGDAREQRARMDVDEPTAKAVGGEILPMIFVVSKAIEYIKNQILDRVVSHVASRYTHTCTNYLAAYVSCYVFKVLALVALCLSGCVIRKDLHLRPSIG